MLEDDDIRVLIDNYHRRMKSVALDFRRYLHDKINWDVRLIGIKGARGVGKTTLMLQYIKEHYEDIDRTLYASLDDLWFSNHSLMDLVEWASQHGIRRLFLDEVHRYPQWLQTLKNIYDNYPDMSVVYTGSSLLSIDHAVADLSRRQTLYTMHGMSFREYLQFAEGIRLEPIAVGDLLKSHVKIAMDLTGRAKIIPLFEAYLKQGYYPFYKESGEDYLGRLRWAASVAIDVDLPTVEDVSYDTLLKTKRLLALISEHVPLVPNMSTLWKELATNNTQGLRMLYALDRACILSLVSSKVKNYKHLSKPDKIFLNNTNLMHALCPKVDKGTERETFFQSQLSVVSDLTIAAKGDFMVDGRYLFEVGGQRKSHDQVKDVEEAYLAVDATEVGYGHRVPLWMFGLLY